MICPKCSNAGVENQALGKTFYYCRTCKDEIGLEAVPSEPALEGLFLPPGCIVWNSTPVVTPRKGYTVVRPIEDALPGDRVTALATSQCGGFVKGQIYTVRQIISDRIEVQFDSKGRVNDWIMSCFMLVNP